MRRWFIKAIASAGVLVAACSGDTDNLRDRSNGAGRTEDSGSATDVHVRFDGGMTSDVDANTDVDANADTGTDGGSVGQGGAMGFRPRACEPDVACNPGTVCTYVVVQGDDSRFTCVCDPSGHLICDRSSGGGAGPSFVCTEGYQCPLVGAGANGNTCQTSNAFCTRDCSCENGALACGYACNGSGPERTGQPCDLASCGKPFEPFDIPLWECSYQDGACNYSVVCPTRTLQGECS